ncbi:MAG: hypothetical protein ACK41V_23255 [Acidovorax sp.]|jgi:hypothetical protein|uniref:hypothetical protein n=1 Tax=Acidovorax sp. TaxID=1872122 RepID=UPI00391C1029
MRHWFLVLMIALLPLRGWVGDAMAVEMLAQPAHAAVAIHGHGADHADPHAMSDAHCACAEHATADSADHQHSACDVCNLPALALGVLDVLTPPAVHSELAQPAERFASSEAQRSVKPPIS